MLNIRELKDLRTKDELINYFKVMGKNITEEEIEALKQSYEQAEENNDTLSLEQLDEVAAGLKAYCFLAKTDDAENFVKYVNSDRFKNHSAAVFSQQKGDEVFLFVNDGIDHFSTDDYPTYAQLSHDKQNNTYHFSTLFFELKVVEMDGLLREEKHDYSSIFLWRFRNQQPNFFALSFPC